jgi:hypothetical protein
MVTSPINCKANLQEGMDIHIELHSCKDFKQDLRDKRVRLREEAETLSTKYWE